EGKVEVWTVVLELVDAEAETIDAAETAMAVVKNGERLAEPEAAAFERGLGAPGSVGDLRAAAAGPRAEVERSPRLGEGRAKVAVQPIGNDTTFHLDMSALSDEVVVALASSPRLAVEKRLSEAPGKPTPSGLVVTGRIAGSGRNLRIELA